MSIAIPSLIIWAWATMLMPMVETLQAVKGAMCGGNTDFVWMEDKNRLIRYAPTTVGEGENPLRLGQKSRIRETFTCFRICSGSDSHALVGSEGSLPTQKTGLCLRWALTRTCSTTTLWRS